MALLNKPPVLSRHPHVAHRRLALSPELWERQVARGLYVTHRGEKLALPVDSLDDREVFRGVRLWTRTAPEPRYDVGLSKQVLRAVLGELVGREALDVIDVEAAYVPVSVPSDVVTHRVGTDFFPPVHDLVSRVLARLRDEVDPEIPFRYYIATLGHDLHVSTYANLFGAHWHAGWADPLEPDLVSEPLDWSFETLLKTHPDWKGTLPTAGFVEHLGLLSGAKVTDAFVSEEIDELVSATSSEYADFDFHEVGTNSAAENNDHTALQTTSGIARATGSPTDSDPIYQNVGTVTADATETWEEHGLFNNSTSVAMMDRSLTGGQSVNSSDQVQYTYQLTKNPEA